VAIEERAAEVARTLRDTADAIEERFGLRVSPPKPEPPTGEPHFAGHWPNGMHVCRCAIGRDHLHP
jgi:hypothetical protein